jgi:enoyl-CoA hydratase
MLFTGEPVSAQDAQRLGMVNRVVPRADLEQAALQLAVTIARKPTFGLKLAKESVNQAQEAQGLWTAMRAAFGLHGLAHAHNQLEFGMPMDPGGLDPKYTGGAS